jgi:3-hydroxyisobutyrate dehydrogenase-like beta-hydroxyacid dehydrogenase
VQNKSPTIGFIGLGVMGGPMCRNMANKHDGHVIAFDLDPV